MNLAIVGSRTFSDWLIGWHETREVIKQYPKIDTVVSGGANGADKFGKKFARVSRLKYKAFLPDWDKFGKSAGMIRNRDIIDNADVAIVFWDGISKGTKNAIDLILSKKIPYTIIMFKDELLDSDKEDIEIEKYEKGMYEEWI